MARLGGGQRLLEDEVGEAGQEAQALVGEIDRGLEPAGDAAGAHEARDERRDVAVGGEVGLAAHELPGGLEARARVLVLAQGRVLGAEVEVQEAESSLDALVALALEQLDVAARLVLGVADDAEVAVVLDADVGDLDALGLAAREVVGDLLVDAALEAVLGAVAEHAHRVVRDGRAVAELAGEVRLDEVEGLAPRAAEDLAQALGVVGDEDLVGVEEHDPVAGRGVEGGVAGVGERAGPLALDDLRAERPRDLDRAVGRAGVDDDDLVDGVADGGEAARQHLLLVADDHAEAQRQALDRLGGGGAALGAAGEAGQDGGDGRRQRRAAAGAAGGDERVEVLAHVRERRAEAEGGAEERLGGGVASRARTGRRPRS